MSILNFENDLRVRDTTSNEHATPTSNMLQKKREKRLKDYEIAK